MIKLKIHNKDIRTKESVKGEQNELHIILSTSRIWLWKTLNKQEALAECLFNVPWSQILEEDIIFR